MEKYRKMKRVPIRRRLMFLVLLTTIITAISVMAISITSMVKIKEESEETLTFHLKQNIKSLVEQKALNTDLKLEHYENYIIFITDYIQDMYKNASELIKTGKYIDAPRPSTPKGVFAMSGILAFENMKPKDVYDEIMFFSHLENAWKPIAEENDGLIDTVYLGTRNGFLPSYDKYSYLTAVADQNKYLYYNYYESEWYKKGMKQDGLFYTGLYKDSQGRGLTITIGKGFNDAKGVRQGVNCADFNLSGLYDEMININFGIGTTSFAFSSEGKLISPDANELDLNKIGLSKDEISSIVKEKNGILEKEDSYYVHAKVKRVGWTICARVPKKIVLESVSVMEETMRISIISTIVGLAIITLIVILIAERLTKSITRPMEQLGDDMNVIGQGNLEHKAAILRNDEVGDVAMQLNAMVERLKSVNVSLKNTQQHAQMMTELAIKDTLTGVRNRTAYNNEAGKLDLSIKNGSAEFGIVMVDMNYLKRTNDIYGHEHGDIAIKKLCEIVCNVFAHSPVFRVGGDEFIVILRNKDLNNADKLIFTLKEHLLSLESNTELEPWEKISAAIGYAKFDKNVDKTIESVFKRADEAMYSCKKDMKAVRNE